MVQLAPVEVVAQAHLAAAVLVLWPLDQPEEIMVAVAAVVVCQRRCAGGQGIVLFEY